MPSFRPSDEAAPKRGELIAFPTSKRETIDAIRGRLEALEAEHRRDDASAAEAVIDVDTGPQHAHPPVAEHNPVAALPGASGDAALLDAAQDALVRALARAPKSVDEARRLLERDYEELGERDVEHILDRLLDLGYLDDRQLAEQLCTGTFARKSLGRHAKANELRRRGIANAIVDEVLAEEEPDVEYERALDLARERLRRTKGVDLEPARRRIHGYLARRGYSSEVASRAIRTALLDD